MRIAKIDSRNQRGLRHVFNISDITVNPDKVDMGTVQPTIDMSFGGYSKLPDYVNMTSKRVDIRLSTEQDPTITLEAVIPGDGDVTAKSELGYGVGNNCYIPYHRVLVVATDPTKLVNTIETFPVEIRVQVRDKDNLQYVNTDYFLFNGVTDLCNPVTGPGGAGTVYVPGALTFVLKPVVLPMGYKLSVSCDVRIYQLALYPTITAEGMDVYYYAHIIKVPVGAPIPFLEHR